MIKDRDGNVLKGVNRSMCRCSLGVRRMDGIRNEGQHRVREAEMVWTCAEEGR